MGLNILGQEYGLNPFRNLSNAVGTGTDINGNIIGTAAQAVGDTGFYIGDALNSGSPATTVVAGANNTPNRSDAGTQESPASTDNFGGYGSYQAQSQANADAQAQADEQAYYQDQINYLNSILGGVQGRLGTGLSNIKNTFDRTSSDINDQESKTNRDLQIQRDNNTAQKQSGITSVDNFANSSYNSLQRLLAGGNAGRSSVGRELIPTLVSRAAGTRRQGVFDTAGANERGIDISQADATDQYMKTRRDAETERLAREESFKTGVAQQEQDLYGKLYDAGTKMDMAGGADWRTANANRQDYKTQADSKNAYLDQLFQQYATPAYTPNAVTTKVPELSKYTVDPAKLQYQNSGVSSELLPYLPSAKKKAQGIA